tara:strand:- start:6616 stop:7125 length:510 start_codon:yes stop_codon:yes gene_type:complete
VKKNLVLLGMMGVGKSTLGRIVAKKQGFKFIDTDLKIEEKCSMKISDIFKKKGEAFFRQEEEKVVLESIEEINSIIALGGGAFLKKRVRDKILKESISIWLDEDLKVLNKRVNWSKKRPLVNTSNSQKSINKLYLKRKNIYKMANYKINCSGLNKEDIVKKIITYYEKQ